MANFQGIDSPAEDGFPTIPSKDPAHATGKGGDPATTNHRQTKSPNIPPTVERHFNRGDASVPQGGKGSVDRSVTSDAQTKDN